MKNKGNDVEWFLPGRKKRFAGSTTSTNDLIKILSEQYLTVKDVYNAVNYDPDAKEILKYFIDHGYENFILRDMVFINKSRIFRKIENEKIINVKPEELKRHLDI